ncbi:zinc-binding metallopeptidase family protein [Derxia gummosa]|uniref:Zinc-binding metallopeptidase family protein n=1 Tax=Derxia gummosa DSM 723 TaxID=1121388 RepID=A0A8B6X9M9_9BURK|nr:putative zinc-binding metallopeptidase [Derxia gummosa]
MRLLTCGHCGQRVFFENVLCGACGHALGFAPDEMAMIAFDLPPAAPAIEAVAADSAPATVPPSAAGLPGQSDPASTATGAHPSPATAAPVPATEDETASAPGAALPPVWSRVGSDGPALRPCANYVNENVCNWMVAADDPNPLCRSCRTTHVIPALGKDDNRRYWFALEQAKRRLLYTLLCLGLPFPPKTEDPEHGLSFHFLEQVDPAQRVLTGHDHGLITLNIAEADDAHREAMRTSMHEPYRTLVGHFRHESGHYYWDRLIDGSPWLEECRALFGDDRADYGEALQHHYNEGPPADWSTRFVSSYATAHPWEDWAECWAHYLHFMDGLETAAAWGLKLETVTPGASPVIAQAPGVNDAAVGPALVERWLPVSQFINAMTRSLGLHDGYPFQMPPAVVAKLEFIHKVVRAAALGEVPMRFGADAPASTAEAPADNGAAGATADAGGGAIAVGNGAIAFSDGSPPTMHDTSRITLVGAAPPAGPGELPVNPDAPAGPTPQSPAPDEAADAPQPPAGTPAPLPV